MIRVVGIDPGIKGAFCVLEISGTFKFGEKQSVKLITVQDFPLYKEVKSKIKNTTRNRIDLKALALQLEINLAGAKICLIEDVGKMPTKSDPLAAFAFGFSTGAVSALVAQANIPLEKIRPDVWKAQFGLTSDKSKSIALAKKLVPASAEFLTLTKHDGRAEAVLLAYFAATHLRFK